MAVHSALTVPLRQAGRPTIPVMPEHRSVVFLRGINVGAAHRITMADLREVFSSVGHRDVSTFLQSGNVVFSPAPGSQPGDITERLEHAFTDRFGFSSAMIIRTHRQLASLPEANPYLVREADPAKVHVAFAATTPTAASIAVATERNAGPEEFTVVGDDIFVWFVNGAGRTKLRLDVGVPLTFRNWNTVLKALAASR
jgi:uncharacterized protein (DUF1697 family)